MVYDHINSVINRHNDVIHAIHYEYVTRILCVLFEYMSASFDIKGFLQRDYMYMCVSKLPSL